LISCFNQKKEYDFIDLATSQLSSVQDPETVKMPKIEFQNDVFDFLEIFQNQSITNDFILKNIGNAPLLIRSVKGSCGCTIAEWPEEFINPGDNAIIKVTFNSGNRKGEQKKTVTLVTNAIPSVKVLTIKGTVIVSKK
tara:strand:- start:108 stop:521 length:414 start_codon:yes stop_codon:yes gene_type:complete